jgi:hypothetical protein
VLGVLVTPFCAPLCASPWATHCLERAHSSGTAMHCHQMAGDEDGSSFATRNGAPCGNGELFATLTARKGQESLRQTTDEMAAMADAVHSHETPVSTASERLALRTIADTGPKQDVPLLVVLRI